MTPWTVAHQAPLSMGFPGQEWQWAAISISTGLPTPGIEPTSPALQVDSFTAESPGKPLTKVYLAPNPKSAENENV